MRVGDLGHSGCGNVNLMPQHRVEYFLIHNHFQSDDTDNIRRLASAYKLDSDRCVDHSTVC